MYEIIFAALSAVSITALIIVLSFLSRCIYILLSVMIRKLKGRIIVFRLQKDRN